ncbi:MAG: hypothetical protein H7281_15075 [Bacteriovorax sp.]|nr:hypothetical protein [Bacteriovorax sp.]
MKKIFFENYSNTDLSEKQQSFLKEMKKIHQGDILLSSSVGVLETQQLQELTFSNLASFKTYPIEVKRSFLRACLSEYFFSFNNGHSFSLKNFQEKLDHSCDNDLIKFFKIFSIKNSLSDEDMVIWRNDCICFCDIPIAQTESHSAAYARGKLSVAIGINKEKIFSRFKEQEAHSWISDPKAYVEKLLDKSYNSFAVASLIRDLRPVNYVLQKSSFYERIAGSLANWEKVGNSQQSIFNYNFHEFAKDESESFSAYSKNISYTKPFDLRVNSGKKRIDDPFFWYFEREWRLAGHSFYPLRFDDIDCIITSKEGWEDLEKNSNDLYKFLKNRITNCIDFKLIHNT